MCETWLRKHPRDEAKKAKSSGNAKAEPANIDWAKVAEYAGWLKTVADLPADFDAKGKAIVNHQGSIKDLNTDLDLEGLNDKKRLADWCEVAKALTRIFTDDGREPVEKIAAALLCPLRCNEYIKQQSDDEQRRRAVERLIRQAHKDAKKPPPPPPPGVALPVDDMDRLNKVHAVLPISGKTRVVTFGELEDFPGRETIVMTQTIGDFIALQNRYRHTYQDNQGETQSVPLGTFWINSQHRRQYDGGMAFLPGHNTDMVRNRMNLWRRYGVQAIKPDGKSGAQGCAKFLAFMHDVICGGNPGHFDYLVKREAIILQKRIRSEIALGLRSDEEGAGKGIYERTMVTCSAATPCRSAMPSMSSVRSTRISKRCCA
jgi:hypothetical protein